MDRGNARQLNSDATFADLPSWRTSSRSADLVLYTRLA